MERINIHIYPSPLTNESRILRITHALAEMGIFDRIEIIGIAQGSLAAIEQLDEKRSFVRIKRTWFSRQSNFIAKLFKTIEWSVRVLVSLDRRRITCVNAHSLAVLPLCYLASRICGAKLIYDTHELETETTGYRGIRQKLGRFVERLLIKKCDAIFVVSPAIAKWYEETYNIPEPTIVRNIPQFSTETIVAGEQQNLRTRFALAESDVLFIYQGAFIASRGIERLLDVFSDGPSHAHLVFMGSGPLQSAIEQAAATHSNIHVVPPVPPHEILRYTQAADIGVCLTDSSCLSHVYSLPNKLFEYLHAGLPVIVPQLLEQQKIIKAFKCGWVVPENKAEFYELINSISREDLLALEENSRVAARSFNWPQEQERLIERYKELNFQ